MNDIENAIERINDLSRYCEILQSPDEYFRHMQGHRTELSMVLSAFDIASLNKCLVQSLTKQIPIKPNIVMVTAHVVDVFCPICNKQIFRCYYEGKEKEWTQSQKSHKHCEECGQKINW